MIADLLVLGLLCGVGLLVSALFAICSDALRFRWRQQLTVISVVALLLRGPVEMLEAGRQDALAQTRLSASGFGAAALLIVGGLVACCLLGLALLVFSFAVLSD
ncbi:hypothetical protein [Polycladidibacter hongkongensis]|uniref:hypothetical protein n=1 Tax=Polycladidibacter hongkongensis TaxID=1647556 RepID=UPI0008372F74|nr:hypothetical protein [Pseudovibrio hongkongensis]